MGALAIILLAFTGQIIMYQLYGKYIGRKTIEQDKVKAKLGTMIQAYGHLRDQFKSEAANIDLVLNSDQLSLAEAVRIKNKLNDIGIDIEAVIVNKSQSKAVPVEVKDLFSNQKIVLFPFSSTNILGYEAINHYLDENRDIFAQIPN